MLSFKQRLQNRKNNAALNKSETKENIWEQKNIHFKIAEISNIGKNSSKDPVSILHDNFKTTFDNIALESVNEKYSTNNESPDFSANATALEYNDNLFAFHNILTESLCNKGKLASAILLGEGKTMLISSLKHAIEQQSIFNSNQKELSLSSTRMKLTNSSETAIINQFIHSSIGLVVDTCKSLNITLTNIEYMVKGERDNRNQLDSIDTMKILYPFLDLEKEMELIHLYKQELKITSDVNKKKALTAGINKLSAMINAKENMKSRFITHLRKILEASRKAEEEFSAKEFEREVISEIFNEPEVNTDDVPENNDEDDE